MQRRWSSVVASIVGAGALFLCLTWGASHTVAGESAVTALNNVPASRAIAGGPPTGPVGPETGAVELAPASAADEWVIECVDCPPPVGSMIEGEYNILGSSLVVGPEGYPHVAFYRDPDGDNTADLYYGFQNATGWYLEEVRSDLGAWESSVSLALDQDGNPHIGFASHYGDGVWYAYRDSGGGSWHFESLDEGGFYPSLALDGDGNPHMSYQHMATTWTYAYRDAGEWHTKSLAEFSYFAAFYTSIDVDSSGHPHIGCNASLGGGYDLWYATYDGTTWYTDTADTDTGWHSRLSLKVGDDDYADIAYRHWAEQDLRYAYSNSSGWHVETADSEGMVGFDPSLALGSDGEAHVAYYDGSNDDLRYAYLDGSGWHTQTLDSNGDVGQYTALDVDNDGYLHLAYHDATNDQMKYAYQDVSGWHIQTEGLEFEADGYVGLYTSIALDDSGHPHVSYYDWSGGGLKYACRGGSGWYSQTVDSAGDVGSYTSLALAGNGYPRISYYDVTNGDLKYAYQDASGWHSQTVDSVGDVGQYTSLALDDTVPYTPHISYYDATNAHPKYAYLGTSGWHSQTVGTGFPAGRYTSLVLDSDGYPHISYYCHYFGDLRYTRQVSATGWTESVVAYYSESWNKAGQFNSLALDALGNPYISYYDEFVGALRVATGWAPVGWSTMWTVDSVPAWDTSLAMGGTYPHVSYYDALDGTLKYAYQDASGWHIQTVDSDGNVGQFTSLALDEGGHPYISHYAADKSNLKLAYTTDRPIAAFTASPTTGVSPLTVVFTDTSSGGQANTWLWSFGDTVTSALQNPEHTYTAPGTYTVTLAISGPCGSDVISHTDCIAVYARAQAAFTAAPTSGPVPLVVAFTNTSSGDYATSLWEFGDGSTSTVDSPSHPYTVARAYTVTLIVDGPGGTDAISRTNYITGYSPVKAAFTAAPTIGFAPLTVTFTNASSGDYHTSLWEFGDGLTSGSESPTHTYATAGTYPVTLTLSGPGGTDTLTRAAYVTVHEPVQAGFTASPVAGVSPLVVTFTDSSTGPVAAWRWDFGDGWSSALRHPAHTYTMTGVYTVSLTARAAEALAPLPGGSDTLTRVHLITVAEPPPQVDLAGSPRAGDVPLTVQFTSTVTGTVTDYYWDFGDGGVADTAHPTHTYRGVGIFGVTLVVTGPGGAATASKPGYIGVNTPPGAPLATFSADVVSGTAPLTVTFTAVTTGTVEHWRWSFGDGDAAFTGPVVTHTYVASGTFDVGLTVSNTYGAFVVNRPQYVAVTEEREAPRSVYLPLVLRRSP